jgi:glyoxylase-like metal-dependent hydrolase (beta-lactamase superfamily II)
MRIYGLLWSQSHQGLPGPHGRRAGQVLAFATALLLAGGAAAQSAPASVEMPVLQVAPRSYFVQGEAALGSSANQNFISNAGFVVTDDSVVVIDALGSPPLAEQLLREIRRITPKPVSHVLVTHYHADHVYGLQAFKAAGASIVAQRPGLDYLGSDTARLRLEASRNDLFPWIDERTRLVPADRWLDGDADLTVGGVEFRLRAVGPSHTPEDMVIHVPQERVLFAGDTVFRGRIPFVGLADSRRWIGALERLLAFDVAVMVPGHGPQSLQPADDIRLTRDYLLHLRATMGEAARQLEPFDEAYRRADWSRFEKLPLFGPANRMNAYNTYLLMEQERD